METKTQLTLEQHGFEWCGSTDVQIVSISAVNILSSPHDFLSNNFFSLASFITRIQYIAHTNYVLIDCMCYHKATG